TLTAGLAAGAPSPPQPREADCTEWHDCQRQALAAAERGDYEAFHDLAWRAVQTGPRKDPSLMYLLARAQALSGRPHDALVMLQRLLALGVELDAATNEDFRSVRQLSEWPDLEARLAGAAPSAPPSASPAPAPPPPAARPP